MTQAQLKVNPSKPFWVVGKDWDVLLPNGDHIPTSVRKVCDSSDPETLQAHIDHYGDAFTVYGEFATREQAYSFIDSPAQLREVA